jgi:flagellin
MRINHNLNALNAWRNLGSANTSMGKSLEKLSSGLRINRAGDDAAGLSISEKMRGQIRGLDMAVKNAQDSISLIQTAEGALTETHSILQRMRELAVQSSNDTNESADRDALQSEINQLAEEITRIADSTEFNNKKVLDGTFEDAVFHIGANEGQNIELSINKMDSDSLGVAGAQGAEITETAAGSTGTDTIASGTYTVKEFSEYQGKVDLNQFSGADTTNAHQVLVDENDTVSAIITNDGTVYAGTADATADFKFEDALKLNSQVTSDGTNITGTTVLQDSNKLETGQYEIVDISSSSMSYTTSNNSGATHVLQNSAGEIVAIAEDATGADADASTVVNFTDVNDTSNVLLSGTAGTFTNNTTFSVTGKGIDISTQTSADAAITTINDALTSVSSERSKLGAYQNRLEHTINNLSVASENLTAAESRIRDVDMAREMMSFTKDQILLQSSNAMLAQANQIPQNVLSLLR